MAHMVDQVLTTSRFITILAQDKGRTAMMSATPIFEQLCRDYFGVTKSRAVDVTQSLLDSPPSVPAHSVESVRGRLAQERSGHLQRGITEWTYPGE
jgi:hypothetical protein